MQSLLPTKVHNHNAKHGGKKLNINTDRPWADNPSLPTSDTAAGHSPRQQGSQVHDTRSSRHHHTRLLRRPRVLVAGPSLPIRQPWSLQRIRGLPAVEEDHSFVNTNRLRRKKGWGRTVIESQYLYTIITLSNIHSVKKNSPSM
jgi:hypothetical protein